MKIKRIHDKVPVSNKNFYYFILPKPHPHENFKLGARDFQWWNQLRICSVVWYGGLETRCVLIDRYQQDISNRGGGSSTETHEPWFVGTHDIHLTRLKRSQHDCDTHTIVNPLSIIIKSMDSSSSLVALVSSLPSAIEAITVSVGCSTSVSSDISISGVVRIVQYFHSSHSL